MSTVEDNVAEEIRKKSRKNEDSKGRTGSRKSRRKGRQAKEEKSCICSASAEFQK